ncbi:MAG: hypothetical protein AAFU85_10500 [Planctomycetota bacterium]
MMRSTFLCSICMVVVWGLTPPDSLAQDSSVPDSSARRTFEIERWIGKLSSDSYVSRDLARQAILESARGDDQAAAEILSALQGCARDSSDMEAVLASRSIIDELEQLAFRKTLNRFLYDPSYPQEQMPGWVAFSQVAGEDHRARRMFTQVIQRDSRYVASLQSHDYVGLTRIAEQDLPRDDTIGWAMLLAAACQTPAVLPSDVVFRVNAALRGDGTGPLPSKRWQSRVVTKMIASYLDHSAMDSRDKIRIAIRYECPQATDLCRRILKDRNETPSRTVTALLAISKLVPNDEQIDSLLASFREDYRTSHVWRSMAPAKTTRRTQVRDIAVALGLHRRGIDPRTLGFETLQADPILVFRAYSLGFESGETREACHRQAQLHLESDDRHRTSQ